MQLLLVVLIALVFNLTGNRNGTTPLRTAALQGHAKVVKALLEAGVEVNGACVELKGNRTN